MKARPLLLQLGALVGVLAVAHALPLPDRYDQRQDGDWNVDARLQNFFVVLAPSTTAQLGSSGISLLDYASKAVPLRLRRPPSSQAGAPGQAGADPDGQGRLPLQLPQLLPQLLPPKQREDVGQDEQEAQMQEVREGRSAGGFLLPLPRSALSANAVPPVFTKDDIAKSPLAKLHPEMQIPVEVRGPIEEILIARSPVVALKYPAVPMLVAVPVPEVAPEAPAPPSLLPLQPALQPLRPLDEASAPNPLGEPEAVPIPMTVAEAAPVQPQPESKPQQDSQPQAESKPQQDIQPQAESKPQQDFQTQAESKPQQDSQPQAESKPQQDSLPQAESKPHQDSQPQTESKPQHDSQPQAESKPQQDSQPQTESQPQQDSQPQPESQPQQDIIPEQASLFQPESQPHQESQSQQESQPQQDSRHQQESLIIQQVSQIIQQDPLPESQNQPQEPASALETNQVETDIGKGDTAVEPAPPAPPRLHLVGTGIEDCGPARQRNQEGVCEDVVERD